MRQIFFNGTNTIVSDDATGGFATSVFPSGGPVEDWTTILNSTRIVIVPADGTLRNLRIDLDATSANDQTFKVYKNLVATALEVTITAGNLTASDVTHSVSVTAGDTLKLVGTSIIGNNVARWSMVWTGTNANEAILSTYSGTQNTPFSTTQTFNNIISGYDGNGWTATEADRYFYCPMAGTIKSFYVHITADISTGGPLRFSIFKNGVEETTSRVDISGTGVLTGNATGLSISFVEGDTLTIGGIQVNSTAEDCGTITWGVMYNPAVDGESMIGGMTKTALSTTQDQVQFAWLQGSKVVTTTENHFQSLVGNGCSLKKLRVNLQTAPGASKTRIFTARKNGADITNTVTISGTDTTGTDSTHTDLFSAGDLVNLSTKTTTASTVASLAFWSAILVTPASDFTPRAMFF